MRDIYSRVIVGGQRTILMSVAAGRAASALAALRDAGDANAAEIGELAPERADGARIVFAWR